MKGGGSRAPSEPPLDPPLRRMLYDAWLQLMKTARVRAECGLIYFTAHVRALQTVPDYTVVA